MPGPLRSANWFEWFSNVEGASPVTVRKADMRAAEMVALEEARTFALGACRNTDFEGSVNRINAEMTSQRRRAAIGKGRSEPL